MKIAIFSDIHGNFYALKSIIEDINKNNYDEVICLGDCIAIGPRPKECLDLIIQNNIKMILGNHELYYLKGTDIEGNMNAGEVKHQKWVKSRLEDTHQKFLDSCPIFIKREINNKKYLFSHFLINNINDEYPFEKLSIVKDGSIEDKFKSVDTDYMFIGHEHKAFKIVSNDKELIDVGSSGCTNNNSTRYTVLDISDDGIKIYTKELEYDRKQFINDLKTIDYPEKEMISKIFFGIDDVEI